VCGRLPGRYGGWRGKDAACEAGTSTGVASYVINTCIPSVSNTIIRVVADVSKA
jgi:hypothetical protein